MTQIKARLSKLQSALEDIEAAGESEIVHSQPTVCHAHAIEIVPADVEYAAGWNRHRWSNHAANSCNAVDGIIAIDRSLRLHAG